MNNDGIPVIAGASGHRDLIEDDLPAIRKQVIDSLAAIERISTNSPRILLSGLAEGADQLVAELALVRGWQVVAVLPMPLDEYIQDFGSGAPRERFNALLTQCRDVLALPWTELLDPDIATTRDQQYRNQGTYLARQSQVVIVLWDGQGSSVGAVGTSWTVDVCRNGPPPVEGAVLAAPETTGLVHIPVRRQKTSASSFGHAEAGPTDHLHIQVVRDIDSFNQELELARLKLSEDVSDSLGWLIQAEQRSDLDDGSKFVLNRHAEADALARQYQTRRQRVIVIASLMTVAAALSQATYGIFASQPWIIAYAVSIGLAYALYILLFRLPRFRIEERFLEYRAFAEASRVQFFWRLAGVDSSVAEHYLQLVKSDVGWVREAVRAMDFQSRLESSNPSGQRNLVRDRWLLDQINYFFGKGTPEKPGNIVKRKHWYGNAEKAATMSFAIGVIFIAVAGLGYFLPLIEGMKDIASAYSASFFLIAGVIKGFAATMGYEEEAASFEKAGSVFRNALAYVDSHPADEAKFRTCIFELGKYALAENADWLLQHRRNAFKLQE